MEVYLQLLSDVGVILCQKELNGPLSLQTSCGIVLLHVAALSGSIKNIELLLKLGFPVDTKSYDNFTPLCRAVSSGELESVEFLIGKGASINIKTSRGGTLLHLAASTGQIEIAKILIKHGLKIDEKDNDGLTPLYSAAEQDQFEFADFLLEEGAVARGIDGTTILHLAASRDSLTAIRCLLDLGFDIESLNDDGYTPLYYAAKSGKVDSIGVLTDNGADLYERDKDGNSLLHFAAEENDDVAAKTLIDAGINVDITAGWWSLTPLHICAVNGNIRVAKLLIDKKADLNCKTSDGRTPLDIALKNNDLDMVCFLTSFEKLCIS